MVRIQGEELLMNPFEAFDMAKTAALLESG